eukprot:717383-Pyramimonas_sp.AAC.2
MLDAIIRARTEECDRLMKEAKAQQDAETGDQPVPEGPLTKRPKKEMIDTIPGASMDPKILIGALGSRARFFVDGYRPGGAGGRREGDGERG